MSANYMTKPEKESFIKVEWAKATAHVITLTDEELIAKITEYELLHIQAQTQLEAARHEAKRRTSDSKSKFAAEQRELDRKYQPQPADKIEFDRKAREEKVSLSKDDKAIETMMKLGISREKAEEMFYAAKKGKV